MGTSVGLRLGGHEHTIWLLRLFCSCFFFISWRQLHPRLGDARQLRQRRLQLPTAIPCCICRLSFCRRRRRWLLLLGSNVCSCFAGGHARHLQHVLVQ